MKKNQAQQKNNAQVEKQETMAAENLKYEVGQEMGLKPMKNHASSQGTGVKPRCP